MNLINNALVCRIELQLLADLTARALRQPAPRLWTKPNAEALRCYAEFTRQHLQGSADEAVLQRLTHEAYRMGTLLRRLLRPRRRADVERLATRLYRNIGIRLTFTDATHLCFVRCYFSRHYTPAICLAASTLDEGILRGISGQPASQLRFTQRITQGCACCKATFDKR